MSALTAEVRDEVQQGTGPGISTTSYSTPIYVVGASQPGVAVNLDGEGAGDHALQQALDAVPIPPGARPAAGSDGHLTVYQPATDTLWELWRANFQSDGWHASWGGAMQDVSKSPGYYTSDSWASLTSPEGYNWGSTASSLPVAAGVARTDELQSGQIDHALAISLPDTCADTFSAPAQRTDGTSLDSSCIPEGAHLRIDPNLDLSTLGLPPITLMLAKAAQRYGLIVRDKTGHALSFHAEDPTTGSDPYTGPNGLFNGLQPWDFLPQFPWSHLQLLKMSLCTQAPCNPPAAVAAPARQTTTASGSSASSPSALASVQSSPQRPPQSAHLPQREPGAIGVGEAGHVLRARFCLIRSALARRMPAARARARRIAGPRPWCSSLGVT
jgi:hypothetical protein